MGQEGIFILNLISSLRNSSGETVAEWSENTNKRKCFWKWGTHIYKGTLKDNLQNGVKNVTFVHFLVQTIRISVITPEIMVIRTGLGHTIFTCENHCTSKTDQKFIVPPIQVECAYKCVEKYWPFQMTRYDRLVVPSKRKGKTNR